ncbi:MAG: hypothetical protein M0R77_20130 [Gammaproteobacteria bacterium]|nr:hypothetical protein [Gammaproteobacteria bacterium]
MRKSLFLVCALAAPALHAADIDRLQNLNQTQFLRFSEDMGAALSYKAMLPAEPLGITGFDVGVEVTATDLDNPELLHAVTGDDDLDTVVIPKLHAHKGLPFDLDVGLFYASVPGSNITLTGAELRYAFIDGGLVMPALAVRGTWSRLGGVDQLDMETKGLELTVSKGFAMITPYAGVGRVWVDSEPNDVPNLESESFSLGKYYLGANLALGLVSVAVEADRTGDAQTIGAKLALRF